MKYVNCETKSVHPRKTAYRRNQFIDAINEFLLNKGISSLCLIIITFVCSSIIEAWQVTLKANDPKFFETVCTV